MEAASSQPDSDGTLIGTVERFRYSKRDTYLTMLGVLVVTLLASLDQTIVATAMPRITADLQGFDRYTAVTTAYMLTSTVTTPIYGKLSDLLGRKPVFLMGLGIFLLGSVLSGTSQSMNMLILFRAFQGLGAGALLPIALIVVGDLFSPRERGKWQGYTSAVYGFSSIIGPAIGGWLTAYASWRWVFYVNLPIGIIALPILIFLMPTLQKPSKHILIDYIGIVLLISGTVPLLLGFSWAGTQYAWLSFQIIGLFLFALLALVTFALYEVSLERRKGHPLIEPTLFSNRIFLVSTLAIVILLMSLFGNVFFIPLFIQGVMGISVANCGLLITPLRLATVTGSILTGQLVSRLGRYKWLAIAGMALSLVGGLLLLRLNLHSTTLDVIIALLAMGLGVGTGLSLAPVIVQNALPTKIAQVTSTQAFIRSIGGTVALAAMGSVMNANYLPTFQKALPLSAQHTLPPRLLRSFSNPQTLLSTELMKRAKSQVAMLGPHKISFFQQTTEAVRIGLAQGIHSVFVLSVSILVIGLIALWFLPEIELRP